MASYASFGALFLKLVCPRLPFILTLQEGDSEEHVRRALFKAGPFRRLLFHKADFLTAISEYLGSLARRLGYYGRIALVPNGVDLKRFDVENLSLKNRAIKAMIGIPPEAPIIISTSRLVEKNGLEDLIYGFARLERGDAHLFILGEGALQDKLESAAQETDAHERMHFLGAIPHTEVPDYIGIADVFVRPSLSEGQGVSFLEAMAMGVPIIGTPVGGIPDFLRDGETGLFCRVNDPESIARAIRRVLDDGELRNRLIENAYRLVKERYTWRRIAPMMEEVFSKFLSPSLTLRRTAPKLSALSQIPNS
jgi:glycosyltransferase involved in cell wall biosynthesis